MAEHKERSSTLFFERLLFLGAVHTSKTAQTPSPATAAEGHSTPSTLLRTPVQKSKPTPKQDDTPTPSPTALRLALAFGGRASARCVPRRLHTLQGRTKNHLDVVWPCPTRAASSYTTKIQCLSVRSAPLQPSRARTRGNRRFVPKRSSLKPTSSKAKNPLPRKKKSGCITQSP